MRGFAELQEQLNDYEKRLLKNIDEHGWFCMSVSGDENSPPFSYSIGFTKTLGTPEFIIFGLDSKLSHGLLWDVFRRVEEGRGAQDGDRWNDLLRNYDCVLRAVHPSNIVRKHFNSAIWYNERPGLNSPLEAFQIVWPDAEGIFPWEPGCAQWVCDDQPPLYLPGASVH